MVSNHVRSGSFNNSPLAVLCLCKHFDLVRVGLIYSPFPLFIHFISSVYVMPETVAEIHQ